MSHWNEDRIKEMMDYYSENGILLTLEAYGLKEETFNRYKRDYCSREELKEDNEYIQQIKQRYTEHELKQIAKGGFYNEPETANISFDGEQHVIGIISDLHLGSKYTKEAKIRAAIDIMNTCDSVIISGDVTEGLSNRAGHVYELSHIGYAAQKEYAQKILSELKKPESTYVISGNHDDWYKMSNGAEIVKDICSNLGFNFLGSNTGFMNLNGVKTMLFHGLDGSSYAISYRLQKIIESFQGGQKPALLIAGHTHKAMYLFDRNVHCISAGCLQDQTPFMMGKKIAAHTGFWKIVLTIKYDQIIKILPEFYPFYY